MPISEPEVNQHVGAYEKLHHPARVPAPLEEQEETESNRAADIAEIQQIEDIVLRQPQRHGDRLEHKKQDEGHAVFF